jgi:hypothetical protein
LNTIINIALNNGYKKNDILILYTRLKHKQNNKEINTEENKKWVTFTYTGNYIRKITKLFKDTNLKVAFKTTTTIGKLLNDNHITNTYEQTGIYNLTCQSCYKVYVGRTGRNITTRFKEHIRKIRSNKDESAFARHILNQGHQYGPMEQIMKLVEHARKGSIMDIKEDYYIYKFRKRNKLIEERKITKDNENQNNLFDIAIGHEHTPTAHVTGNRDINTPQNTPETSASTSIRET